MFFQSLFQTTIQKCNFEDILQALKNPDTHIIINTLPITEQECLIKNTIPYNVEEKVINELINRYNTKIYNIIIYGKNTNDITTENKYKQLRNLGFTNVYIYTSGLFEWCLLQDIYGIDNFPTTKKVLDILKYKPESSFLIPRLTW